MKIAIIGAGNGGQAMAGHFALMGHDITLYNRSLAKIAPIAETKEIRLSDKINSSARVNRVTDDLKEAVAEAELVMITTTADAHREIAAQMAAHLTENQVIVLNPGRTFGALEFSTEVKKVAKKRLFIAESQSLLYACRAESPGNVRIIGIKDSVYLAAYPSSDTDYVLDIVNGIFPCFVKAENILHTGLENIGAMFHPAVIIFNAAAIERGNLFYFYNDMTPATAEFLNNIDNERLNIGRAFGIDLLSLSDWVSYAYKNIKGATLREKMLNNPAYYKILAPNTLYSRLMLEDVPTGIVPLIELAKLARVETPLMCSILNISQSLLRINFGRSGRTLKSLGLKGLPVKELKRRM